LFEYLHGINFKERSSIFIDKMINSEPEKKDRISITLKEKEREEN
jgi:hypothetical protein